jgi:hypothetical protein
MVRSLRCLRNPAAHRARIQLGHRGEHSQLFDQRLPLNPASQKRPFTPVPGIGLFFFSLFSPLRPHTPRSVRTSAFRCDPGCGSVYPHPHDETDAMSRRINVIIDDDTWWLLEKIPLGERSRTVNQALRIWAQRRQRRDAVAEMDTLRTQLPKVSTDEVVRWIREDREHGH